jgi:hypothetical protein
MPTGKLPAVKRRESRNDNGSVHFSFQFRDGSNGNGILGLTVVPQTRPGYLVPVLDSRRGHSLSRPTPG